MSHLKVLFYLLALSVAEGKLGEKQPRYHGEGKLTERQRYRVDGESGNTKNRFYLDHLNNMSHADTERPTKAEAVIEKFVETLMSGERYLKMVETVERKLNHLDATFHERSNTIIKYLAELLKSTKKGQTDAIEPALMTLKADLEKLKISVSKRIEEQEQNEPTLRGRVHGDPNMEHRLNAIEDSVKSIAAGVEAIITTISEVKNRQSSKYTPKIEALTAPSSLDVNTILNEFRRSFQEQKNRKCECKSGRTGVARSERYPTDCHEIMMQGFNISGIYKIKPDESEPFYVLCELRTAGGGWTVFQNRFDGSQDFYKTWWDYKHGFGNLAGEFWLGLDKLYYLTNQKLYELRVEMETQVGQESFSAYSVFTIGPEYEEYPIRTLGSYYGTGGDSLTYHAGQKFSTPDRDNDEWKDGACAVEHGGAWWYKECDKSNLNGKFMAAGDEIQPSQTIYWISFKGPNVALSKTKMMIRPLPASNPLEYKRNNRKSFENPPVKSLPVAAPQPVNVARTPVNVLKPNPKPKLPAYANYRYGPDTDVDQYFNV